MLELLITNAELITGNAFVAAVGWLMFRRLTRLEDSNTEQHEQGRREREQAVKQLSTGIDRVETKVHEVGERVARVEGTVDVIKSRPFWERTDRSA